MASITIKNFKTSRRGIIASSLFLFLFIQGCSSMNELVMNKAETTINGHQVVIRPCRDSYTRTLKDTETNRHHVFGCGKHIKVEIRNEVLTVNDKSYGMLNSGDSIEVKNDKVLINKKEAVAVAMK